MSDGVPETLENRARSLGVLTTVAMVYLFLWGSLAFASLLFDLGDVLGSNWAYLSVLLLVGAIFRIARAEKH